MPHRLVLLGRREALALHGHHVEQFRALDPPQHAQHAHHFVEVVAVHGSEIAEIEALEEVALVQQAVFHGIARLLAQPQQAGRMGEHAPQPLLEAVVAYRGRYAAQVAAQGARGLVDGHVVVVEDHQQVGIAAGAGIVQSLERQAARHRRIADHGHHLALLAPQLRGLGHAERRRDRHRGVAAAEGVVGAFGHAREAADAAHAAVAAERLATAGDDLVTIGLVAYVPHDAVVRRVVDIVQCGRQLHGPEARRQMPGIDRALLDDVAPQLVAVGAQLLGREAAQIGRRVDPVKQIVAVIGHMRRKDRNKIAKISGKIPIFAKHYDTISRLMQKYDRILLKLSGESLQGTQKYGLSTEVLHSYAEQIRDAAASGVRIAVVIGGGNIFRGLTGAKRGFDRVKGDQMGMLATIINSLALQSALEDNGVKAKVLTSIRMEPVGEYYSKARALEYLDAGYVVIVGGGTSNPYFSTDSAAALRGIELETDVLLKGTRVDGVYTADPEKDPAAVKFDEISFDEVYARNLKIMDLTAFTLCRENRLPVIVFDMDTPGNLARVLAGEAIGTLVKP